MKTRTVCGSPNLAPDTVYEFRVQAETAVGSWAILKLYTIYQRRRNKNQIAGGGASVRGWEAAYYPRAKRGKFYLFIHFFTRQGAIL